MFIPTKIKVGYQERSGTYTGKLAYVIYYDNKGKLRKETSWESWRDKKIDPLEFTNEPTSGFVLNKGVGGVRGSSGWDARNEYIRVWDPRDFEFEISVANLLFILQETSSIKGKGLEGEFVYAWDGTELVLLPVGCEEYKNCAQHTLRLDKKVQAKDVKPGYSYVLKNGTQVLYLGRFLYNNYEGSYSEFNFCGKKHVFLNLDDPNPNWGSPYIVDSGFTKLAESVSTNALPQYPDELDKFMSSKYNGEFVSVVTKPGSAPSILKYSYNFLIKEGDEYYTINLHNQNNYWYNRTNYNVTKSDPFVPELKDGKIELRTPKFEMPVMTPEQVMQFNFHSLYVVNSRGTEVKVR
jgi:hypothetical protein